MANQMPKRKRKNNLINQENKKQLMNLKIATKPKSTEDEVKELKQQMETILGVTKTGLDIIDSEFNIRYIDPEWAKVYGDPAGKKCYKYFMDRSEICPGCGIAPALKTKTTTVTEEVLVKEGNRPIQVTTIPFQNSNGEWLVAEVNVDISERKRIEEALRKAHEELEIRVEERTKELMRAVEALQDEMAERKRAEDVLRESEERYRGILKNIADGYYEVDLTGNLTFFNDSVIQLLGYSKEELIGKNNREYMDQANAEKLYQTFNRVYRTEESTKGFGWEIIREDGTKRFIEASVSLVKNPSGQPTGFRGIVRDITERKRTEKNLKESEEKYRSLVEGLPQGIVIGQGIPPRVAFANHAMTKILGYNLEEFSSLSPKEIEGLVHPEDRAFFLKNYKDRLEGKSVVPRYEIRGIRKDGTLVWLELSSARIIYKGQPAAQATFLDITERKRAEEALRESEERYRTILENVEDGYYEVDIAGNVTFCNDSFGRLFGYSKDKMIGMNNRQYTDEENAKKLYQAFNKVYRTREPTKAFDLAVFRKDGTKIFGEVSVSLMTDAKDQPIGFRGIARDITNRKQAEEALHNEKQRFQSLTENAPFGMVMIDKNGTFRYINPKFRELFGYDLTDVPNGKTWFRKAYPDPTYRHYVIGTWIKDLESIKPGDKRSEVFTVKCKDGTEKIIDFIPVQLETGENLMACEDITERKRAEEALRISEEKAKQIAQENAIVAEIGRIISSSLNIKEVYERFAEEVHKLIPFDRIVINLNDLEKNTVTVAYTSGIVVPGRQAGDVIPLNDSVNQEIIHTRSSLLIQSDDMAEFVNRFPSLQPYLQVGLHSMMMIPLISNNQVIGILHLRSIKPNAYTGEHLKLAERVSSQIAGAIANAQLYTEHMRSEEEKTALQEQFRQSQKMEAVGRLAGGIAHDFNNLLTVIKGYSQLSLLDLKESDILWGNIQEIQKATQRAADLTRQLLAFSRRQILDLKVLDLNTLLKDLNKMLRRIIGEDIELVTLLAEGLGRVKIDPGQFEQMILNLAVNARDAMVSGGKLTIETENVELDEEYVRTHISVKPGSYVQLSISDTGIGMSLDTKEKAFEPFFTTKEKGKGTGLGLSTVYGIVKQSEGNIWVYSEPGRGTTFKIYFPRVEEKLDAILKEEESDSLPGGNETVLLVEDDPLVRDLAHRLLIQQGYKVLVASNGEEALRVVQENGGEKIHLLLTDVVMPRMGGKELSEKLKRLRPEIGVLYTSGYTDNAIVHHGTLEPGTYFLQKPFSHKTLSHKVREVLDGE
jgi:two-component system, cell cycle sensor histidine kinase and response regulator CckA